MNPLSNAGSFLISTLFGLYILAIMLRVVLQMVRADFYNPLSQFIVKITNPPLIPLRRVIPGFAGLDMAAILLMLVLQTVELYLIGLFRNFPSPDPLGLLIYATVELASLAFYIFLFAIFIQAILSWINPGTYNPMNQVLYQLTNPVLRPARRLIPPMSGMDLSPMVAMIGLWLIKILLIDPLSHWSLGMAYPVATRLLMQ